MDEMDEMDLEQGVLPRPLPTGNELMSGPITTGGATRQEKEIEFIMDNIHGRIVSLRNDESFQKKKVAIFALSCFSAMGGVTLILFGLHLTVFFEKYSDNMVAIVFGSIFCAPMLYWVYFLFAPGREEVKKRRKIHIDRKDRRKPTLFNQLVEEARQSTEPPVRRIRVLAHIRKHDHPIVASTMLELCDAIHLQCGLAVERQLLRFEDEDLDIQLDKKLDVFYKMDDNSRVYVYNKGGVYTANSPLKQKKRRDILTNLHAVEGEDLDTPPMRNTNAGMDGRASTAGSNADESRKSANLKSSISDGRDSGRESKSGKGGISWAN
ncbi:hypothetical protein B484DRAFT_448528 [Ochromonadaceae sp. CCMP2298]|nr:hypothetical protein B484DRAFT_448528 [Ochromonadaceae sp. CCMP2298]